MRRVAHESAVFRPSWRQYGRSVIAHFSPVVVILALFQFWLAGQVGGKDSAWGWLPIGVLLVALGGDVLVRMCTVVRLTPSTLEVRPPVILHREIARERVGGVAMRGIYSFPSARVYAVIYDRNNRNIATLPQDIWDERDLHQLQDAFGSADRGIKYTTSEGLSQEFAGALVLSRYYGWALAVLVVVLIFVGAGLQGTNS